MKKTYFNIIFSSLPFSDSAKVNYWLIIGTYRQRAVVSEIKSPPLRCIPMKDVDSCNRAGGRLLMKYKNLYGNLISDGLVYLEMIRNKVTFLHREHSHHLYSFHSRKNHFLSQSKLLIKQTVSLK